MLEFDANMQISLRENPNSGITLYTVLIDLPLKQAEPFMHQVMMANLLGKETGESVLGLDKEGKKWVFLRFLPEGIEYKNFRDAFENFVNYAEVWREDTVRFQNEQNVE